MASFDNMSPEAMAFYERFSKRYPGLKITSTYRDPAHNAKVGGAKHSQHIKGNAFDYSVAGMSPEEQLEVIRAAWEDGARGMGVYGNSLHFDVGPARAWGPSYGADSIPKWARPTISELLGGLPPGGGAVAPDGGPNTTGGGTPLSYGLDPVDPNSVPLSFGDNAGLLSSIMGQKAEPMPSQPMAPARDDSQQSRLIQQLMEERQPKRRPGADYHSAMMQLLMGAR